MRIVRALALAGFAGFGAFALLGVAACTHLGDPVVAEPVDAGHTAGPDAGVGPFFYPDIANILNAHCVACHKVNGIGPFSYETDDKNEVRPHAPTMVQQTMDHLMPPWLVDDTGANGCPTWHGARSIAQADVDLLSLWNDHGGPRGNLADKPAAPPPDPTLTTSDATLSIGGGYLATTIGSATDDYRCFVVDPGAAAGQLVVKFDVLPGDPRILHHVILWGLDDATQDAAADGLDTAATGLGYPCANGPLVDGARLLASWTPGVAIHELPAGTGVRFPTGHHVIAQVHYSLTNVQQLGVDPGTDPTKVDLVFASAGTTTKEAKVVRLTDPTLAPLPKQPTLVKRTVTVTLNDPSEAILYGLMPHMHTRGKKLHVSLVQGGTPGCMADVQTWNPAWQELYELDTPRALLMGDQISIECDYDTSNASQASTPFGEADGDEDCAVYAYFSN